MRRLRVLLVGLLVLAVVCVACVAAVQLGFLAMRGGLLRDRPIVLIHRPLQHQQVLLGEGLIVHATARDSSGVDRMELWVDGEQIVAEEQTDGPASPFVLAATWVPATRGDHTLVVRAVSHWGVAGQSSVAVVTVAAEASAATPPAAAGEGAAGGGTEAAEAGGGGTGAGASVGGGEPPAAQAAAPGSAEGVVEAIDFLQAFPVGEGRGTTIGLRLELLSLHTQADYEGLHCYIGLGGAPPRWYPDQDGDPSTDESFASLGGGDWDVGAQLAGASGLVIPWRNDLTIPIDVACVGLSGGGLEALELGRLALALPPEAWGGAVRRAEASGSEGAFAIEYRITPEGGAPSWDFADLDPTMAFPTNLRLDWQRSLLLWDYQPLEGQEPIDGFRVYLDGMLQWTESAEARQSRLPFEWVFPPCGDQYSFTVDAYRGEDWSWPAGPVRVPEEGPSEDCYRSIVVSFETLAAGELGQDQDHIGWVGPTHGSLYANDQSMTFDGRCGYGSGVCGEVGLEDDTTYDLPDFMSEISRGVTEMHMYLDEGETVRVGFIFRDEDFSDDDLICQGEIDASEAVDRLVEGTIVSDNGACEVTFTARPVFASPVEGIGGAPPRPMLVVEDLTLEEETGELQIHIRNVGAATVAEQDLEVALAWPSGEAIGTYTFPLYLAAGARTILQSPEMAPGPAPALSACVTLDPNNTILEEDEDDPSLRREPFCRPLPDLTISRVNYDSERGSLLITVVNYGEGALGAQTLEMVLAFADGGTPQEAVWPEMSLEPWVETLVEWHGLGGEVRERLIGGYTLTLDPNGRIAEEDVSNNQYTVAIPESGTYRLTWGRVFLPYYYAQHHDENNADMFSAQVQVLERASGRVLVIRDWQTEDTGGCRVRAHDDYIYQGGRQTNCHNEGDSVETGLGPNLAIEFTISGHLAFWTESGGGGLADYSLGEARLVIEPDAWATATSCNLYDHLDFEIRVSPPGELIGPEWYTYVYLCRMPD